MFRVINQNQRVFNVRVVLTGARYGLDDRLVNDREPLIEFYAGERFISRYYWSTFEECAGADRGLALDGHDWTLSLDMFAVEMAARYARFVIEGGEAVQSFVLRGVDAIDYAERTGATLCKYADPTEDAREGLSVEEAREIAASDPSLIWVEDVESVWVLRGIYRTRAQAHNALGSLPPALRKRYRLHRQRPGDYGDPALWSIREVQS